MVSKFVERPHIICIPYPAQGHINPMLKLAKLLHTKGFYITFVHTEFNHNRLLRSRGPDSLKGLDDFRFETIPDGLPPSDRDATQDIPALCESTSKTCTVPFRDLIEKINTTDGVPKISCIISDGVMSFTLDAAEELGIPEVLFWTTSACGFLAYLLYRQLIERGIIPFKDEDFLTNGSLDTPMDWIPGMNNIRLRDIPSFIRTTDPSDLLLNFLDREAQRASRAAAVIMNTFDNFEHKAITTIKTMIPHFYTIGPLNILSNQYPNSASDSLGSNLWKEDTKCLEWLKNKDPKSVVYVNFGSITVMTAKQLEEFAWGLANSNHPFLWIIRPDLVMGDSAMLPPEFVKATEERGLLSSWCPQEKLLQHPSIGVFLTHCGWNSTMETVCSGVPIICWPFFAEQQTNCRYACTEWGIGMEIDNNVKRDEVEGLVREMMEGDKGKEIRNKALEWKAHAEISIKPEGSSYKNFDDLINQVLWPTTG
ncbi:7-deoxyloganetin glucosyltransferase [Cinnamomum micranthum f. kanehirae]|uniref:Glycosyltransferase n=1 Tax=Cinnamomum micranthum f. kanehirae TaxID=337451 RepID=A0A3S5WGG2_9MAGN|nr:7-deoxyloganetin glucosyltransferase [Cinnamomum micranthum f. kanehirae]